MEASHDRQKTKLSILNRIKDMTGKPQTNMYSQPQDHPFAPTQYNPNQYTMMPTSGIINKSTPYIQMRSVAPKVQPKPISRIDTEQDFRKMPYEGKAKYDNELKALNALKSQNPEVSQKPKKMFFEHYDTTEPYMPNIPNNPNPSGRPPNIPPEMYEGIVVKPKRPWVYLGTENLPPVQYQEINDTTFKSVQKKVFEDKQDEILARRQLVQGNKARKKGGKRAKEESMLSEGDQQGFEMSDQIDMDGGDSVFASDFRSQSRINRKSMKNSEFNEEEMEMSEGTQTKKRQHSIFNDSEGSEEDQSEEGMSSRFDSKSKQSKGKGKRKPRQKKSGGDDSEMMSQD